MEKKETNTLSIFQRPVWVSLFALTAAISWGWAYCGSTGSGRSCTERRSCKPDAT